MKQSPAKRLLALALLAALAGCGGGSAGSGPVVPLQQLGKRSPDTILTTIVGVGDSLTAGYQSDGFLGATGVDNPFFKSHQIPPTQENGWWADLDEQASGEPIERAIARMYDPATSPLPLINGPGLDNQIVPYGDNPFFPFIQLKSGDVCTDNNGFDEAGYRLKGLTRVRINPDSTTIRNVGIPGLTLHEANTLHAPQTSTCKSLSGIPGLLNQVIAEESGTFWPVLGNFVHLPRLTDVNAAASRHPTLATVWLGANDVLKYMGSGGRFLGGDRDAGQASSDLRATISTLRQAGARVVVANLPNIVDTGYFQRVTNPKRTKDCAIRTYASCLLGIAGIPFLVPEFARHYHLDTPDGCIPASTSKPCGYLTLPALALTIQYYQANNGEAPDLDCAVPAPHCKPVAGSGLGAYYITPAFAGKIQALNDAINQGIDDAARSSNAPLVDVHAIFEGLASGNPSNPYFHQAASINPGKCCTLGYLWGILSFDGVHPSNTGYALIADDFIKTINHAYGTHIPEVDIESVYAGTRCSNRQYCFPDPYAPPHDSPYKP